MDTTTQPPGHGPESGDQCGRGRLGGDAGEGDAGRVLNDGAELVRECSVYLAAVYETDTERPPFGQVRKLEEKSPIYFNWNRTLEQHKEDFQTNAEIELLSVPAEYFGRMHLNVNDELGNYWIEEGRCYVFEVQVMSLNAGTLTERFYVKVIPSGLVPESHFVGVRAPPANVIVRSWEL